MLAELDGKGYVYYVRAWLFFIGERKCGLLLMSPLPTIINLPDKNRVQQKYY
jgi:uncharacterized membrane protein